MANVPSTRPGFASRLDAAAPAGDALLRIGVGLLMMPHGAQKLFGWFGGHGLSGTAQWFESVGFAPGMLFALPIALLEFFGGAMLALGLLTRVVAGLVVIFMLTALSVHWHNGYFWNAEGGGWEMPALWAIAALAVFLKGGGPNSLDAKLFGGRI